MSIPILDPNITIWIDLLTWLCAIVAGLFTFWKWRVEMRENRAQRERELRWEKAKAAKEILDEMLSNEATIEAMRMLDWDGLEYSLPSGKKVVISEPDYLRALRIEDLNFTDVEVFIRDCFDGLFYYMSLIEHYLRSDLVQIKDVQFPLDYYMKTINKNRALFDRFLQYYRLTNASDFLKRLDLHLSTKK